MGPKQAVLAFVALCWASALAVACGGKVVVPDGEGDRGGGGSGGGGVGSQGVSAKDCPTADCHMNGDICSCETVCDGPKLRADCKVHEGGMLICECHYAGGYMGTCSPSSGAICSLPDGCCEAYVP